MTTNPYQAPEVAHGVRQKARKVRVWLLPIIVVAVVSVANFAVWRTIPQVSRSATLWDPLTVFYLFNMPGLPLFIALQMLGLIPGGDDDDYVRGIWAMCCTTVTWGILAWIASFVYARLKSYETSNGN